MLSSEMIRFIEYTLEKIDTYFSNHSIYALADLSGIEYDVLMFFFDIPEAITLDNLIKLNTALDKYLSFPTGDL